MTSESRRRSGHRIVPPDTSEMSSSFQPGPMNAIPGAINIAAPDTVEAQQNITLDFAPQTFHFIGKPEYRCCARVSDCSEWPIGSRPIGCRKKSRLVAKIDKATGEPLEVSFGATAC